LAIPGIAAAGGYEGLKLLTSPQAVQWGPMLIGIVFAALIVWHFA
jgi:hypothetical protein